MNQNFSRPVPMTCPACHTSGVKPRITETPQGNQLVTEARWVCSRCSHYFHRATINSVPISNNPQK